MRRLGGAVAVLALMLGTTIVHAPTRAAAAPACSADSSPATENQSSSRRPVVFVHGWTSNGEKFRDTGEYLKKRTGNRIQPYYFDYRTQSTTWAGNDLVGGCLATYLTDVSTAYHNAGGDRKLIVVGHSMGGLAILYAAGRAGVAALIGGVVTFDTPYLGSPFGNRALAAFLQGSQQTFFGPLVPPAGSDAQICLGPHSDGTALPTGCTSALPGYLPATAPVTQIAGQITVRRTVLGIHLYDINLGGDGIVPTESSLGYLQIQTKSAWPTGARNALRMDNCTMSSDNLTSAAWALRLTKDARAALLAAIAQFYVDNKTLDDLLAGKATYVGAIYMGAAQAVAGCSHVQVVNDPPARDHALAAINGYLDSLQPATSTVNIAPVDKRGNPTSGWSIDRSRTSQAGVDCSFNDASPSAPEGDIYYCSPVAAGADACWVAADRVHMLCLTNPDSRTLVELTPTAMPTAAARRTETAVPIRLDLDNGDHCRLRNGGSWGRPASAPDLVGWYRCTKAQAVWGKPGDGINKSGKTWTVRTGGETGPLTEQKVVTAYYVATAP
jgi:hypothetical protein